MFPRPCVAAGFAVHFQQNEIVEAALLKPPRRAQSRDAAANDDYWNALLVRGRGQRRAIADLVPARQRIVDKRSGDAPFALRGHPHQGRAARDELPASAAQWLISFQSRS